jgi:hypothetical protein
MNENVLFNFHTPTCAFASNAPRTLLEMLAIQIGGQLTITIWELTVAL